MLKVGAFRAGTCAGVALRAFLQTAMSAAAALGGTSSADAARAIESSRAKSVLFVWLWGAPSHLDTFDPKPDAPSQYRGPFAVNSTRTPGVQFSELLPQLAHRSELSALIRSQVTFAPGHPDAGTYGLTGFPERPEPVQPNFGAIVGKHRGQQGTLPQFVSVGRGIPRDVVRIVDD